MGFVIQMPTFYDVLFFTSSAELKMELLREKEVREGLEKQLAEEQKSRGTFMDPHFLKCLKMMYYGKINYSEDSFEMLR
jgi:hypothetical protein